ncbi:MAG: pirin family protein [bacterium]|nr:pirin family protein [bacterium]
MSNTDLIIEERSRDIGDFLVGRILPFRKKRMVGPFIFIDHMGPTEVGPGHYMDVDQHPHIGLSTLTYLLQGEILHEDSIGSHQVITPGSVNLMVAGSGVTHTERTPSALRDGRKIMTHGYQIWIALPELQEEMAPEFHHIEREKLPSWQDGAASFVLICGTGYGKTSPVPYLSPQFMVEIKTSEDYILDVKGNLEGEIGICIVEGSIDACGEEIPKGNMLVSKVEGVCKIVVKKDTHLLLFGGEAMEERHIYWNFVASSKEKIEEAKTRWENKDFPRVPGDNSYVPLPGR